MINRTNKYIKHIEQSLIKKAPKKKKEELKKLATYIGTKNRVLGYDTSEVRKLAKAGWSLNGEGVDWLNYADKLYKGSLVFEVKNTALYLIEYNDKKINEQNKFEILPGWINHTDNWAHSDNLSKFYTRFLESDSLKEPCFELLKKWNSDADLWKRRQSLVSLFYYAKGKKNFLPYAKSEKMIRNLINDKEYFVQKGLGWALRESFHVYPQETFNFISKNAEKISSTAFSAACEKMSIKEKELLKTKRRKTRLKN